MVDRVDVADGALDDACTDREVLDEILDAQDLFAGWNGLQRLRLLPLGLMLARDQSRTLRRPRARRGGRHGPRAPRRSDRRSGAPGRFAATGALPRRSG